MKYDALAQGKDMELHNTVWSTIFGYPEVWTAGAAIFGAIIGAAVGGLISYVLQNKALREKKRQHTEDFRQSQLVLANSLIVKVIKIHSNLRKLCEHLDDSFADAKHLEDQAEPWQFVRPLASLPDPVLFSSKELSMLMSIGNDDVFNSIFPLDTVHNSLVNAVQVSQNERSLLVEQLDIEEVEGEIIRSPLGTEQSLALRPKMIYVNSVIEGVYPKIKRSSEESRDALFSLHAVLQDSLGLTYKLESYYSYYNSMRTPSST